MPKTNSKMAEVFLSNHFETKQRTLTSEQKDNCKMDKKHAITISCLKKTHLGPKGTNKLSLKGLKNIFQINSKQK